MSDTIQGLVVWATNRQDYFHYTVGTTLYTDWDTSVLRNLLTTIFIVVSHLIVWLGSYHLRNHNHARLLNGKIVPLSNLTSWLSLNDAASYFLNTFRLPGGHYSWLMLIIGALSLAHQYFVNSFIQQSLIKSTCAFDIGIVCIDPGDPDIVPSATFSATSTIFRAQSSATYNNGNNGNNGIWKLIPYETYYFGPQQDDLLGQWTCKNAKNITIASADWSSEEALQSFLTQNQLYNLDTGSLTGATAVNGDQQRGFLSWYTSSPSGWDTVTASMAVNPQAIDSYPVTEWSCTLATNNGWKPPVFDGHTALSGWDDMTYGYLEDLPASEYGSGLELMLNAMFMAAAGGNIDTTPASAIPASDSPSYGCMIPGTQILVGIWIILALYLAIFVPLLIFASISLCRAGINYKKHNIIQDPPTSVYRWQVFLVQAVTNKEDVTPRSLRNYYAAHDADGKVVINTIEELNAQSTVVAVSSEQPTPLVQNDVQNISFKQDV